MVKNMHVTLSSAGMQDVDRLMGFMQVFCEHEHLPFHRDKARAATERLLQDDSLGYIWIIEADQKALGYVVLTLGYSLEYHGRDAFIDEIYLDAAYRGRGIGRRVLALVEDVCRSAGVHALHLEVDRGNTAAQALYRKAGFRDQDRYLLTRRLD